MAKKTFKTRCSWADTDALYRTYHDKEWGVQVRNDRKLFEFLVLEGAQAGLSWLTVLRKRENYRRAYDQFDPQKIANYGPKKIKVLLSDEGIIRNRLKVAASITNAQAFLKVQKEFGSFSEYMWGFVGHKPIKNKFRSVKDLPARTELSDALSKDLKRRGFKFVGSTIVYAHMQAVGMVNDHVADCFRHREV
ncbi:MAG: DNA-3-methyladenine glycosylase [Omnitrophica WOR_2 bacterium RIFCSPHIGHO2_02_FULL_52_10]|nr:MAG: DNA-3-methyladenine glycosylase [Omnitrophica WOR_2 bacterium RIFCSPHIGHO2_02_FULL_52_10]